MSQDAEKGDPADTKPGRLRCCVPFCNRSRRADGNPTAWICGPHWRTTPAAAKIAVRKAARSYRKRFGVNAFWVYPPGSPNRLAAVDAEHAWMAAWEACKAAAIESAMGITR